MRKQAFAASLYSPTIVTDETSGTSLPAVFSAGAELIAPTVLDSVSVSPAVLEVGASALLYSIAPILVWVMTDCVFEPVQFEAGASLGSPSVTLSPSAAAAIFEAGVSLGAVTVTTV